MKTFFDSILKEKDYAQNIPYYALKLKNFLKLFAFRFVSLREVMTILKEEDLKTLLTNFASNPEVFLPKCEVYFQSKVEHRVEGEEMFVWGERPHVVAFDNNMRALVGKLVNNSIEFKAGEEYDEEMMGREVKTGKTFV